MEIYSNITTLKCSFPYYLMHFTYLKLFSVHPAIIAKETRERKSNYSIFKTAFYFQLYLKAH